MMDYLQGGGVWLVTGLLMLAGLVGCVVPVLPGHLLIFCGALGYRLMTGPGGGLAWWGVGALLVLMIGSQIFEIVSGSIGSKWFGGTKWGALGALVGGIAGLFFLPIGLLVGPLAGAFGFEMAFAKQKTRPAAVSGVGSVVGTLAGIGVKVAVGAVMIIWFFVDVFAVG